jgi:DNA-binding NtrC family response regulator
MTMASILVVDDDRSVIQVFHRCFDNDSVAVWAAASAAEALEAIRRSPPDVVVLDVVLPDRSGLSTFEEIHSLDAELPVIFVTAAGTSHTVIEAMKLGALDYLLKPLDIAQVREVVAQAMKIRQLTTSPAKAADLEESEAAAADPLSGRCAAMQEIYKAIGRVAQQNVNVLIRGESGTGKELVARAIYQHSPRADRLFLAVNCAAIPEPLLESELFGHEKGSFTGAVARRAGKFEQCDGGTLFLDEVADMAPLMQSKVLRAIQEQQFERVGGNTTVKTDVRILAATNRNLEDMVAEGQFRADLYYRLNGYTIALPPLRERGEDIPVLIARFVRRFNQELGKSMTHVSPEAMQCLIHYPWPGNIRELQSVLKQAMLEAAGPILLPEFLPPELRRPTLPAAMSLITADGPAQPLDEYIEEQIRQGTASLYADSVEHVEDVLLTRVLRHTHGNQSRAAEILGITRGCLRSKIRAHGITVRQAVGIGTEASHAERSPAAADC